MPRHSLRASPENPLIHSQRLWTAPSEPRQILDLLAMTALSSMTKDLISLGDFVRTVLPNWQILSLAAGVGGIYFAAVSWLALQ